MIDESGDRRCPQTKDSPGGELWNGIGQAVKEAAAKKPEGRKACRQ